MRPPRKVPTVSTTARARNSMPVTVTTPRTTSFSTIEIAALLLEQREVGLVLERAADECLVELAIGLHARRAHRRTLAGVQRARLDGRGIRGARHHAAQRVDLLDQVTLADAADGGIAAHLAQRLDGLREQQRARAHARGGERGLGAGVPATDHDYVKWTAAHKESPPDQGVKGREL